MRIRAILFDKDGTLVDLRATWVPRYRAAARALARAAGYPEPFALELLRRLGWDPIAGTLTADSPLLWATNRTIAGCWAAEPELRPLRSAGIDPEALANARPLRYLVVYATGEKDETRFAGFLGIE